MKCFVHILLSFFWMPLHAQIAGIVTDADGHPIEFANVALYTVSDSALIAGTLTDQKGQFMLSSDYSSDVFLKVSLIGYETKVVEAVNDQQITLLPESTVLGEVVVTGDLPRIRVRNDALVASVENTVLSRAGTANDVLKRLPAVTGDNGVFEIFGKGTAKILINNREMRDESELDRISSSDIREVEIVYNPGARYDASVKAIIRIHTIRKLGDGFGFDFRSTYLQMENADLRQQLNLNYRDNGWDLFGTLKYERYVHLMKSVIRQATCVDTLWTQENQLRVEGLSNPFTAVAGIHHEFSPRHQVGMKCTLTTFLGVNRDIVHTASDVYANGTFYDRWVSRDHQQKEFRPRYRINGYYCGTFGRLKVDFNGDLYHSSQTTRSDITESSEQYDDRFIHSDNRILNRLIATRTLFSYPLLGGTLSVGNEFTHTRRKDDYQTGNPIIPSTRTAIHDQNLSFFAEYSRSTPIGQITAGLRYEDLHWNYLNDGERNDAQSRSYTQWFPGFTCSNTFGRVKLQISYSVKTVRPAYWQMGSNIFYVNRFSMQTGNPFLKPATRHDVSLIGSWRFLQLAVSCSQEKNLIIQWAEQMEEHPAVTRLSNINLSQMPSLSAFLTVSPKVGIWSPQVSVGFNTQWLDMEIRGEQVRMNHPMPIASLNNSFSLPKGWLLTVDGRYQGKGFHQNFRTTANQFLLNAGLTKSFFEERLSLTLKGRDLFHGEQMGFYGYYDRLDIYQFSKWDTRALELTVRYTFNKAVNRYQGKGAGDREISRFN